MSAFAPFYVEERVRQRIGRWKFPSPTVRVARRMCLNFDLLRDCCRPCVVGSYFRTVLNGWPTTHRMRTMPGVKEVSCVMGCPTAYDKIEHYAVCPKAWAFLQRP